MTRARSSPTNKKSGPLANCHTNRIPDAPSDESNARLPDGHLRFHFSSHSIDKNRSHRTLPALEFTPTRAIAKAMSARIQDRLEDHSANSTSRSQFAANTGPLQHNRGEFSRPRLKSFLPTALSAEWNRIMQAVETPSCQTVGSSKKGRNETKSVSKRSENSRSRAPGRLPGRADWRPAFLVAVADTGKFGMACEKAGVAMSTAWEARKDPAFLAAYNEALGIATERLKDEAHRRAVEGLKRLKFTAKGAPIIDPATGEQYYEHEYSDFLLGKMLAARAPEYREKLDVSGTIAHVHLTLDEMQQRLHAASESLPVAIDVSSEVQQSQIPTSSDSQ
jgi:hypothetical protein